MEKSVFIVVTHTYTAFARLLQKFGKMHYNHTSVSLDRGLSEMYGFARTEKNVPLAAKLVHETIDRYQAMNNGNVDCMIFEIPLKEDKYKEIHQLVYSIYQDSDYIYNLFSVISYPITKGFSVEKSYSCIEFACYVLQIIGISLDYPLYHYAPEDIAKLIPQYLIYKGNLLDYSYTPTEDKTYFRKFTPISLYKNVHAFNRIAIRTIRTSAK